jgi:hypothetical protein
VVLQPTKITVRVKLFKNGLPAGKPFLFDQKPEIG